MRETWAIKRADRIIYIAAEQYGPPQSLTVSTEDESQYYHPKRFLSEAEAKTYLDTVVKKTPMGMRWPWQVVKYT